jgi:predicted MPP superfamily phosphohydrolase
MIPAGNFILDAVTALILAAVPLYILELRRRAAKGEDVGLGQAAAALLTVFWLLLVYGSFIESRILVTREYQVDIGQQVGAEMRIAVVGDMHLGLHKGREWAEKVVAKTNFLRPDLILLVGDFASVPAGIEDFAPFGGLKSRYGTYAVLGNWDYRVGAVDVRKKIESYGIEVLTNESVVIGQEGQEIRLIGLDDWIYGDPDWNAALKDVPPDAVTVAVGHEPDFAPAAEVNGIGLLISGHTHGGQLRLPGIGAVPPLPIHIPQDFDQGLFDYGRTKLFITPGVGESGAQARLLCPPEISVLELKY